MRKRISVLIPAYNEQANVERAYRAVVEVLQTQPQYDFEIIFTDNHSTDKTFEILSRMAAADKRVRVLRFSRNIGYDRSLLMGYKAASGDCSIQIDCDLQDPPRHIPEMLRLWEQGHHVVYGVRRTLADTPATALTRRMFYAAIRWMSEDELPLNAGEFRLVDRRLLDEIRKIEDTSPYMRGLISALGFSQVGFEYDREARIAGESKFPLRAMFGLALDGILNHSLLPLRIASTISLFGGLLTFFLIFIYVFGAFVLNLPWPAGFATTTVLLLVSITLNALFLGIIGEYLGRMFMQSKRRPIPVVQDSLNFAKIEEQQHAKGLKTSQNKRNKAAALAAKRGV
jgi:polyisoprenyl-phosphate glycosyltransferase